MAGSNQRRWHEDDDDVDDGVAFNVGGGGSGALSLPFSMIGLPFTSRNTKYMQNTSSSTPQIEPMTMPAWHA